jgi:hypothetical protein
MDKRAKERIAIAKDALLWIKAEALQPRCGVYVHPLDERVIDNLYEDPSLEEKQLRDVKLGKCEVCAKGALFLAKAVRYNDVFAVEWHEVDTACEEGGVMLDHFDQHQLELIEAVFEGWEVSAAKEGFDFYLKYPNPKKRLIAILKNIIKNDGTFIP